MLTSLQQRVLSAVIFLPFFLWLLLGGNPFHFFIFVTIAAIIGLYEFFSFNESIPSIELKVLAYVLAVFLLYFAHLGKSSELITVLASGLIVAFILRLRRADDLNKVSEELGLFSISILYIVVLLSYLLLLRSLDDGSLWLLLLFLLVWFNDTAAYFTGMSIGKRKLYPKISPKKSVEGFFGGIFGSVAAAMISKMTFLQQLQLSDALLLALSVAFLGPVGDLAESMLKRSSSVKDSGSLIPGHGGILDRIDSILFSAPFVYYLVNARYGGQG